jgi:protein-S-isoprenylcysteine O-methyltransferase Ste14
MNLSDIIYAVWFLSEILLNRFRRSDSRLHQGNRDKQSLTIIWISIFLSITAGVLSAGFFDTRISGNMIIPSAGLAIILSGMLLRFISVLTLGRFFTVDVTIRQDHKIIKKGVYMYIRHPSYTGSVLSFIGFGLSLNNWVSLLVVNIPIIAAFLYRIRIEEKLLTEQFGTEYSEYMKVTYRLFPWIY